VDALYRVRVRDAGEEVSRPPTLGRPRRSGQVRAG
jgi:hypothetical protein